MNLIGVNEMVSEAKFTTFEILLIISILLLVCMFIIVEEHLIAIIAFGILYHTFLWLRRQKCDWLREPVEEGE